MDGKPPRILSLVLIPALITLALTVLRLVAELRDWDPLLAGNEAGGGGAILGISWLIFVFGLWFGIRLQRGGGGPASPGRALALSLLAIAVLIGGFLACQAAGLIWIPDAEHPGEPRGTPYFVGLMVLGVLIALVAWRRAALTLLVYAILARVPVLALTWLAVENGWDTHYVKLAPGFPPPPAGELFTFLATPQVTFWPTATILLGTVMASLGALLSGRPKAS